MTLLIAVCLTLTIAAFSSAQTLIIEPNVRVLPVKKDSEVVLACRLAGTGQSIPTWSPVLSGGRLSSNSVLGQSKIEAVLTFDKYSLQNEQLFTCTYENSKAQITLLPVEEKYKSGDHFYYGNKTGTLTCEIEVSGAAVTLKKWLFKDEELENTNKKYKTENSSLIIERPNRDDAGPYTAVFEIKQGSSDPFEYKCEVNYTAGPLVMDLAKSINLEKGDDLKISCEVKGYPMAVVYWQRDKQNLTSNDTIFSDFKDYKGAQIEIKDVQFDDAGNYTCTAYSAEFQNSSTKSIIVRVKDPIAWVWPLIGILAEILILALIILICRQVEKRKQARELDSNMGNSQREKDE